VFEIKSHILKGDAQLHGKQVKGAREYAEYVLQRLHSGEGKWGNVTPEVLEAAETLRDYIRDEGTNRGMIYNIDYALNTAGVVLRKAIWKKFR